MGENAENSIRLSVIDENKKPGSKVLRESSKFGNQQPQFNEKEVPLFSNTERQNCESFSIVSAMDNTEFTLPPKPQAQAGVKGARKIPVTKLKPRVGQK